ncbi:response regulator transcription factor [Heliorestis convoluta]|uniref:Stage 0 sporulation protein A homolog n=1 Tax=Heliorestis convoluta TaxID=356322 RepID=A0A5Q2MVG7_9FIRM|nr:response regulator transcription factor [Heliorestis convoluta]QGG46184.1 two-component system response regulator [Heliorestis convoluta]
MLLLIESTNKQTILVIEDEKTIVDVLEAYLVKEGFKVVTALTGSAGWSTFQRLKPDLVLLDLMLPDYSGEELCQMIRKESDVPILMLTAKSQQEDIIEGLSLGADDYVIKPFSPKEVIARVKALLRRSMSATVPLADKLNFHDGALVIDISKHEVSKKGQAVNLTPAEFKLLLTLARYPGRTYSRSELLDRVLGDTADVYERTIDGHIKNLRQKIEDDSKKPSWILTVFGAGYKFSSERFS